MVVNIVNLISRAFSGSNIKPSKTSLPTISDNPFSNPFVTTEANRGYSIYAQNKPVSGGYFAGYYNGKANIVGRQLFIEA